MNIIMVASAQPIMTGWIPTAGRATGPAPQSSAYPITGTPFSPHIACHSQYITPEAPAPDYERDQTMPKAKRAMNRFGDLGVDLVMGGHLHRAYIGNSLDVFPGSHRDHGIIIVQCGTTTSHRGRGREREKNSLNVITIDADTLRITHYMHFHEYQGFYPVSRHAFPRSRKHFIDTQ